MELLLDTLVGERLCLKVRHPSVVGSCFGSFFLKTSKVSFGSGYLLVQCLYVACSSVRALLTSTDY